MSETRFHIFRYQIIPTTQIQLSLFDAPITVDELKARKNEFFFDVMVGLREFRHSRAELVFQIDVPAPNIIVLRLGANRGLKRETREYQFWGMVEKYPRRIVETEFKMISPNMSNISSRLKIDLSGWNQITNTQETKVALKSDKNSSLTFQEGDEPVTSLVDYASEGGGNIKMKIKGIRRKISTSDSVTEISIKDLELELERNNLRAIGEIFKEILE